MMMLLEQSLCYLQKINIISLITFNLIKSYDPSTGTIINAIILQVYLFRPQKQETRGQRSTDMVPNINRVTFKPWTINNNDRFASVVIRLFTIKFSFVW